MFENLSDKELLQSLRDSEEEIKRLKKNIKNLREENEKRKTIVLGKPLDISASGRFTASVQCNDNQAHQWYDNSSQDVGTFYSLESAIEFTKFLIHLAGALKANFYGRPIDPKVVALLLPQGSFIAQDKCGVWVWFEKEPNLLVNASDQIWEMTEGRWVILPFNLTKTDDWKSTLIECGLPNGTKELPFQTEEMSEIMDLRSCLRKIAHNQESLTAEKMSQMAREVLEK